MKIATLFMLLLSSVVAAAETLVGTAKNSKGAIVYIEKHSIERDGDGLNKFIRVEYSRPDGSVFATMTSDFSRNKMVPDTKFEDSRFKRKIVLRYLSEKIEFEEFINEVSKSKKTIPASEMMVASQGFDNFIRANLKKLSSAPLKFRFGVIANLDFYSLIGYQRENSSKEDIEFGIRADSWLVRMFAKELKVVYDRSTMRLKSFAGRSNISGDQGESQDVTISYEWKEGA